MKGLLHRLAARAVGTAPIVRSNAMLPWQSQFMEEQASPVMFTSPASAPPNVSSRMQRPEPRPSMHKMDNDGPRIAYRARERPEQTQSSAPAYSQTTEPAPAEMGQQRPPPWRVGAAPKDADSSTVTLPRPPSLGPIRISDDAPLLNAGQRHVAEPSVASKEPLPAQQRHAHDVTGSQHQSLSAPVRTRAPSQQALAPESCTPEQPTEVHVHIGRIDVTAIQEAPKPRRKSEPNSAVSLDAYLASRSRT